DHRAGGRSRGGARCGPVAPEADGTRRGFGESQAPTLIQTHIQAAQLINPAPLEARRLVGTQMFATCLHLPASSPGSTWLDQVIHAFVATGPWMAGSRCYGVRGGWRRA